MILDATDLDIVARTVMAEAEGEEYEGKVAVAAVIYNRAKNPGWWGKTVKDVCLTPKQFSCWNTNDPRRKIIGLWDYSDRLFRDSMRAAIEAVDYDPTNGADHYFAHGVVLPEWAEDHDQLIVGNHTFIKIY